MATKYGAVPCRPETTDLANRFSAALALHMAKTESRPTHELLQSRDALDAAVGLARVWDPLKRRL
jgi:hypothetical protein